MDKNPCKDREKHILEARNNKESSGSKLLYFFNPLETQIEKEQITGQVDKNAVKPKPH